MQMEQRYRRIRREFTCAAAAIGCTLDPDQESARRCAAASRKPGEISGEAGPGQRLRVSGLTGQG
jgi:hypothetical protein